jgi:hypothetical protein
MATLERQQGHTVSNTWPLQSQEHPDLPLSYQREGKLKETYDTLSKVINAAQEFEVECTNFKCTHPQIWKFCQWRNTVVPEAIKI